MNIKNIKGLGEDEISGVTILTAPSITKAMLIHQIQKRPIRYNIPYNL